MIGLETWFNNFTQYFWSSQTKESIADIPLPRTEYAIWWTMKCGEIMAFLGGCVAHPVYRIYRLRTLTPETTTNNSKKVIRNACRRLQGRFLLAGLISGPALSLMYSQFQGWSESDVRNQCYKIRCDTNSLVLDRYATAFFLIGWYWKRFQGGCDGINIAIAYFTLYDLFIRDRSSPLLTDKVKPEERFRDVDEALADKDTLTRFWRDLALQGKAEHDLRPSNNKA